MPLAVEFSKKFSVIGFDRDINRVDELKNGLDRTLEVLPSELNKVLVNSKKNVVPNKKGLLVSSDPSDISLANIFIVTVPTPIDENKKPNLDHLLNASKLISEVLKKGDIVIYESTVYPGCTEEDCVPILENHSGLKFNYDFFCGYSPERINPGDKINRLVNIKKVTSGSTPDIAKTIDSLYQSIILAGTHLAPNIRVAEASKAIENAQRDVNISFVNELALLFDKMGINTHDVLKAAGTKWNFLPFKPGLVGGHCIGVDPYYLAYKAKSLGYHPAVLLSGRKINDQMGVFIASKVVKLMIQKSIDIKNAKILILGFTFKENCPDTRNTQVIDVVNELNTYNSEVSVYDPWADKNDVKQKYNINLIKNPLENYYDSIILAVGHHDFTNIDLKKIGKTNSVVYDTKSFFAKELVDGQL